MVRPTNIFNKSRRPKHKIGNYRAYKQRAAADYKRALERHLLGSSGAASPVRKIDPVTGAVIEVLNPRGPNCTWVVLPLCGRPRYIRRHVVACAQLTRSAHECACRLNRVSHMVKKRKAKKTKQKRKAKRRKPSTPTVDVPIRYEGCWLFAHKLYPPGVSPDPISVPYLLDTQPRSSPWVRPASRLRQVAAPRHQTSFSNTEARRLGWRLSCFGRAFRAFFCCQP